MGCCVKFPQRKREKEHPTLMVKSVTEVTEYGCLGLIIILEKDWQKLVVVLLSLQIVKLKKAIMEMIMVK